MERRPGRGLYNCSFSFDLGPSQHLGVLEWEHGLERGQSNWSPHKPAIRGDQG